tara:strand:- start:1024 stop:1245 length:222 start_codon:yes stop_codon:yes gene_type:complete
MKNKKLIIKAIREDKNISQQAIADEVGINRSYLSAIENGVFMATIDILLKIARALDCKYTDLYQDDELEQIKQ